MRQHSRVCGLGETNLSINIDDLIDPFLFPLALSRSYLHRHRIERLTTIKHCRLRIFASTNSECMLCHKSVSLHVVGLPPANTVFSPMRQSGPSTGFKRLKDTPLQTAAA